MENLNEDLDKILSEIEVKLICPKCGNTDIIYKEKKTEKLAQQGFYHVGAYCKKGHFIKWVKQTPEVLKKVVKKKTLF